MALKRTHQPAIDDKQLAGHIAAIFGCKKDHRARDIFRITGPAQRYLALIHVQFDEFGVSVSLTPRTIDIGVDMNPGATALTRML